MTKTTRASGETTMTKTTVIPTGKICGTTTMETMAATVTTRTGVTPSRTRTRRRPDPRRH